MLPRCITFDLDDTLWACAPVIERAEQRLYAWLCEHFPRVTKTRSLSELMSDWFAHVEHHVHWHHDMTRLRKHWLNTLAEAGGYDRTLSEEGFEVFWAARNEVTLFQGVVDALDALRGRFRVGAITNGNADVQHIGIGHHFDFVVYAAEVGAAKPHAAIFEAALQHAAVPAAEVLHVGDDPLRDVHGAAAVGMRTVWVNGADDPWPLGDPRPDAVIRGLDELEAVLSGLAQGASRGSR